MQIYLQFGDKYLKKVRAEATFPFGIKGIIRKKNIVSGDIQCNIWICMWWTHGGDVWICLDRFNTIFYFKNSKTKYKKWIILFKYAILYQP